MANRLVGRLPLGESRSVTATGLQDNHQGQIAGGADRAAADDHGKLLLRQAVGGLMLFHGIHKVRHGVDWMSPLLEARGRPALLAYGSYAGEMVAPLLILAGVLVRPASLVVAGTMVMAVFLALSNKVFALTEQGGWAIELNAFFFLAAVALALMGGGRLSTWQGRNWWSQ